jgi:hypothetical protein
LLLLLLLLLLLIDAKAAWAACVAVAPELCITA